MDIKSLTIVALGIILFSLVSARLRQSVVTPSMVFVTLGFIIGGKGLGWLDIGVDNEVIDVLAEITLVVVLFTDAARIDLKLLRREHNIPVRLLTIGLPLTIVLGTLSAIWLLPELGLWQAAVLAAIVAPTDAALAHPVVTNRLVPARIRQAISVESGLNDGICLPIFLILLCGARAAGHETSSAYWLQFGLLQITLGPLVGVAVGYAGGRLIQRAWNRQWMNHSFLDLSSLALAAVAFGSAELVGGNGFIAAFCAGLTVGNCARSICKALYEFGEAEGQLLSLLLFLIVGAAIAPTVIDGMSMTVVVYALLSLTVIRMVPATLSLLGTRLRYETLWFVGWFGPRGTASVVFAMILLQDTQVPARHEVFVIAMTTVLLSIFAHGLTAFPAARWYARCTKQSEQEPLLAEHEPLSEMPFCCQNTHPTDRPSTHGSLP